MDKLQIIFGAVLGAYGACALLARVADGWIRHEVIVDAPLDAVWSYGSDSTRAAEWSVFFHHITPIEGEFLAPDGTVGALRVCYRNADETGISWDETTEEIDAPHYRRIRTFNLANFPFGFVSRMQEYEVHQRYEAVEGNRTKLAFSSRIVPRAEHGGLRELLLRPIVKSMYVILGAPAGQVVFVWNLENIKAAIETRHCGDPYVRPHAYAPELPWETRPLRWWVADVVRRVRRQPVRPAPPAQDRRAGVRAQATA